MFGLVTVAIVEFLTHNVTDSLSRYYINPRPLINPKLYSHGGSLSQLSSLNYVAHIHTHKTRICKIERA